MSGEERPDEKYENVPQDMGGAAIVAESLAHELGSGQAFINLGRADMRIMSVFKKSDVIHLLYAKVRSRKSRIWRTIYDELLHLNVGVDGRGRRDIIRMEQVARGGSVNVESEMVKPGVIARNVYDRAWEKKEMDRIQG